MNSVIETDRLRLRPHRIDDFDRYLPLWVQPEPPDTAAPIVLNPEEVWARLLRFFGHWTHFGYGLFLVEDRFTGQIVAETGIAQFRRGIGPGFDEYPEAAWRVLADHRGKGIAAEAMSAVLPWFDRRFGLRRTVCLIQEANGRSLRVAERLGYRRYATSVYRSQPALLFERFGT